ncbi:MAG: CidA/LrgA family protein [Rhodocyclaceae bacterium]|nr:CidA/LrgA family protein [Rhodocyclaceae bacterium]
MIAAITLLLLFQLAGEAIALYLALPVPGPVIGMALLFLALALRGGPEAPPPMASARRGPSS